VVVYIDVNRLSELKQGDSMTDNMFIWDQVKITDPDATKEYSGKGGFKGTSIKSMYNIEKATKLFGAVGIGWGWIIVSERIEEGHPITGKDADGKSVLYETMMTKVHTLHLRLWYMLDGKRGEIDHFGHTPFVYIDKNGVQMENEPSKKSLTDAIGKCLSMLGFSADIFMGEFDNEDYVAMARVETSIQKAEDKEAEILSRREELINYIKRNLDTIEGAVTENEVNGLSKTAMRHLVRQAAIPSITTVAESGQRRIQEAADKRLKEIAK
jgi:hypothetical protein